MTHISFAQEEVLVTGGLGFIGSNLAQRLVELGARVTLLDSLIPEYGGHLFNIAGIEDRVRVHHCDLRDPHGLRPLVTRARYLFNLAAQTSHADSMTDPLTDMEINIRGQLHLLEACRRYNPEVRILFASTRQIYGTPTTLPVKEDHPLNPVDINGIHKLAGEGYHGVYHQVHGLQTCCLRLTNTYGPRVRIKDARYSLVGYWIRLLLEGRPFEVWDGAQVRDFTYVDDVVEAMLLAMDDRGVGRTYNLGGERPYTLGELAETLIRVYGGGEYVHRAFPPERRMINIGDIYSDYGRIREELGWQPRVGLEEGVRRTLDYYRQHLGRYL